MNAQDLADKAVWDVLLKIKKYDLLRDIRDLGKVAYGHPSKEEENILLWLQDQKTIVLENLSRFPRKRVINSHDIPDEVRIKLVQPAFDEIYNEYEEYLSEPQKNILLPQQAKNEIKEIILTRDVKGMEKKFIQALAGLSPVSFTDLKKETGTKSLKALKSSASKKLKGTRWSIESPKRSGWGSDSFYQLKKLTD